MSDIKLNNQGDLEIIQQSSVVIENSNIKAIYDLNSTENYIKDLILKAIKTPRGKITLPIQQQEDIIFYDKNYGSDIYRELSEGLTLNFLSRVKNHIINSLNNAGLNANINQVEIGALNTNTIQLNITYSDNTPNTIIQLNL